MGPLSRRPGSGRNDFRGPELRHSGGTQRPRHRLVFRAGAGRAEAVAFALECSGALFARAHCGSRYSFGALARSDAGFRSTQLRCYVLPLHLDSGFRRAPGVLRTRGLSVEVTIECPDIEAGALPSRPADRDVLSGPLRDIRSGLI